MELADYLIVVRRRWALIALVLVACVAGAAAATMLQTPKYRTSTRLIVSGTSSVSAVDEISRRQLATQRAVAFSQIATTPPAVGAALQAASREEGPFSSKGGPGVSASATGKDPFLDIVVTDSDPHRAAAVANAFVTVLPAVIRQLEQAPNAVPEEISSIAQAGVPSTPFSPRPKRNLLIGLAVGVVLGLGSAFVRESLDRRLRDSDEVERASGVTLLGVVPTELPDARRPVETHPMSSRAEAYRKVRTNLTFTSADGMPPSLLITSSISGEGKTTLATNLSLACARTGQSVVLVDGDLRRPMVSEYLDRDIEVGLTNVLAGTHKLDDVIQHHAGGDIDFIASGPIPANPSELLGSTRMQSIMDDLRRHYDVVIIDAPPVLPVADALVLAVYVDGVVLVAKVGDTTRDRLRRAKDALLRVNANLVGVVPNAVVQREDSAYAYAYRYRSRGEGDALTLYTKSARKPEFEVDPSELQPAPRAVAENDSVAANSASRNGANGRSADGAGTGDIRRRR